jgi:predicted nuclease of predicted toxin-antitoxin system
LPRAKENRDQRRRVRAKFLADENFPLESILQLRKEGIDFRSVTEHRKGMADEDVLKLADSQGRILITFDQDFGEMAFRRRL